MSDEERRSPIVHCPTCGSSFTTTTKTAHLIEGTCSECGATWTEQQGMDGVWHMAGTGQTISLG